MANAADNCYALLNQYLGSRSCGGVADPPPPPPEGGVVSGACAALAPCCDAAGHSPEAEAACSALVSTADDTACADARYLYCSHPRSEAGADTGVGHPGPDASADAYVDAGGDGSTSDVFFGWDGDADFAESGCTADADACDPWGE